jgi:glutamate-1-semialdehyde 2,1-aminomutase
MPGGVNHDARRIEPFPPYIVSASGSRKHDVDGNEFIDYVVGHAALVLGHSHPAIVAAVRDQIAVGSHLGGSHPLEAAWAELVCNIIPSAESVRFVMSGTEATLLALRVARAFTGRQVVIRVQNHFHGWHDYVVGEANSRAGLPSAIAASMRVAALNDIEDLRAKLQSSDVAAVILEPEGARSGTIPPPSGYLQELRELTAETGTLLVFDEVVSGFRVTPGGVQQQVGVTPDLTTLAKAVAGGLPGGALAGRRDVLEVFVPGNPRLVSHQGTYNANPVSAAAGIAALKILSDPSAQRLLTAKAGRLRQGLNQAIFDAHVRGFAFGQNSSFRVVLGDDLPALRDPETIPNVPPERLLKGIQQPLAGAVYRSLLLEGIDFMRGAYGWLSTAHSEDDIDDTIDAFGRALNRLVADASLSTH